MEINYIFFPDSLILLGNMFYLTEIHKLLEETLQR